MDAQAYTDAIEQRRAMRQALKRRLAQLREAGESLASAAGNRAAAVPTLEIRADPIAQVEPQIAQAMSLARQIQAHHAKVQTALRALEVAKEHAKRFVRNAVIAAVVLAGVVTLFLVFGSH